MQIIDVLFAMQNGETDNVYASVWLNSAIAREVGETSAVETYFWFMTWEET